MVGRRNADTVDTFNLKDVATTTTFWLSMGYNFGCVIPSSTIIIDFRGRVFGVKPYHEDIAEIEVPAEVVMATIVWLSI